MLRRARSYQVARQAQLDQGAGERLPDLVRRLEEALYRQAASKVRPGAPDAALASREGRVRARRERAAPRQEEYEDAGTLRARLQAAAVQVPALAAEPPARAPRPGAPRRTAPPAAA